MVVGDFAQELETVVIGSGPGGYVAAIRAAQLGQNVAIIEKDEIGGTCLNVGCIPSKALITAGHRYQEALDSSVFGIETGDVQLDFSKTQKWKNDKVVGQLTKGVETLLKKNKVEIIKGAAYFMDQEHLRVLTDDSAQSYSFRNAIIATGSRPIEIKGFPFGARIIDSTAALALDAVPKRLIVIGGGYIGSELAGAYANLGSEVTILEGLPSILANFDPDMVRLVTSAFKKKGVKVETEALAKGAVDNGDDVTVTYEVKGKEETITADYVLVSVGRRANTDDMGLETTGVKMLDKGLIEVDEQSRTSVKGIYAIGDVVPGLALAHKASYEAKVAAAAISGKAAAVDYVAMPAVSFTDPEIASVGLSETEAKKDKLDVTIAKFPYAANGRALSLDAGNGFVRLISDKESNILLGAQVAGHGASDLIAELTLAIEARMAIEDISLTVHSHPSLAEIVMDAAELAEGLPIHTLK